MTDMRLQRYLAQAGVAARRKAEELITAGRVRVNGEIVRVLGTKIDPERDDITVDGEAVVALDKFYVILNKPKACITAVSDDRGRPTVMDFLPNLPVPVKPVGRLDFYTEGVLLLTNDGELAARLLAPASHVAKTYHVKVHGQLGDAELRALRKGVRLDDGTITQPAEINVLPGESKHTWLAITIYEGKHRQIHRMLEALGFHVDKLQRVAFANLTFHGMRVGDARELAQGELNELRDLVGLDHSAVARGRWRARREATDIPRRARAKMRAEADEGAESAERPQASGLRPPAPDRRPPSSDRRPPAPDRRPPASDRRPPSSDRWASASDRRSPSSDRRPPSSDRWASASDRAPSSSGRRPFGSERRPSASGFRTPSSDRRAPAQDRGRHGTGPKGKGQGSRPSKGQGRTFGKRAPRR